MEVNREVTNYRIFVQAFFATLCEVAVYGHVTV